MFTALFLLIMGSVASVLAFFAIRDAVRDARRDARW